MNIKEAKSWVKKGNLDKAEIRRDPGTLTEWFIILVDGQARRYILVDADDNPLLESNAEALLNLLKQIGFRSAEIYF